MVGSHTIVWSRESSQIESTNGGPKPSLPALIAKSKATKIKLTLKGFFPGLSSDIRKSYYEISEIKVRGSCDCNGYSAECDVTSLPEYRCNCGNGSFTQGSMVTNPTWMFAKLGSN